MTDQRLGLGPWAAGVGAGIAVALATNLLDGSDQVRQQLVQLSIQLTKNNEILAMLCKQFEAQPNIDKQQNEAIQQIKLILERNRIR